MVMPTMCSAKCSFIIRTGSGLSNHVARSSWVYLNTWELLNFVYGHVGVQKSRILN
jgi:hypothetical protein